MKLLVVLEVNARLDHGIGPDPVYKTQDVIREEIEKWFCLLNMGGESQYANVIFRVEGVGVAIPTAPVK